MMSSNSHCGPDIVKYFVVEPANDVVTGATGNFFVCSGTTFLSTISGCTDSVDFNGNTFYNNGDVFFNGIISACTGIHTSNIYGCSPITVHDELILLSGLTLSSISQDNGLTEILARDSGTGEVKYRDVSSIAPAAKLQNTYFVSSLSGDNSTALVGDINNPWKTITEARNQAVVDGYSNSLIHVYSGEYLEDEIQYENGNFYFEPNSKVTTQRTASGGTTSIFRLGQTLVYESNTYSANTCNVYGYGDFSVSATTDTDAFGGFILSMLGDSNSYFEFNDAYVHSGEAFWAGGNSILTLEGHDILLDPSGSDGLDFSDTSTTLINVNDIVGGNSHYNIHYRQSFAGKSVVNFNKLIGSDQLIGFDRFMQPTAEITMNFNLIEHTGGSRYIINSGDNLGAKVTLNGDFYAPYGNGILLYHDAGEYNINGNITCRDTALLAVGVLSPSNDFVLNYNGDIVTSGVTSEPPPLNSNGGIELNKITANLNGSLTNLSLGDLSNGINIDGDSILSIDNFDINVASGNTIGTSSSNVVNIKHSLNINKPMSSGITTTGLFNYTGTTNVGDLVVYNTPTNDNSLTQILGRNSTTGDVEYRDVSSIISAATSQDTFVSGGTYNEGTTSIDFSGNSIETTFSVSLSGISSNIDIYNTYFVSPTGDDSTAVRGDLHNPFKTITAARNKVVDELSASTVTGDTLIHVYPGNYIDQEVQYENGNFYFTPNTVVTLVQNTTANRTDVFRLGTSLVNTSNIYSANTCNIYGQAKFIVSASTDNNVGGGVVQMYGNAKSHFECDSAYGSKGTLFSTFGNSELKLKANELELESNDYVLTFRESSKTFIDVDRIKGGTGGWAVYYFDFNGQSILNVDELVGGKTFQPLGFRSVSDGAEIVLNINKLSHEPDTLPNTQWLINNTLQSGGKITYNGNMNGINGGIIYGGIASGGEFNYNGDILVANTAIFQGFPGVSSTDHKFNFNGTISVSGNSTTPTLFNGGTITLNGSLLDLGGTGTNGISTTSSTDLRVDNFRVEGVTTNSIIGSGNVDIFNSLYIDKPIGGTVTTTGQYIFTGTTYDGDLNIYNTPTNDNTLTEILGRNSTTGDVEYIDVSSIIGAASANTFTTGFTYDNANTFTITDNDGGVFNTTINTVTGLTSNGNVEVVGNLIVTGGTGNVLTKQVYVENNLALDWDFPSSSVVLGNNSDGTIINGTSLTINSDTLVNGSVSATTYFGDGSNLTGIDDTFVTGFTFNNSTYDLTIKQNEGQPDLVSNLAVLATDVYVVSGVYNSSTGIVTYTNSSGGTFQVSGFTSGMTDSYTTDSYISGTEIRFDNNIQGANYYNVDLLPLLSGKTNNTTFNTYTANTQVILDGKIDSANNVGGANELFKDKSGTTLNFRTLSGGSNTTISTIGDVVKVDVAIPADNNTFVTGFTYNDTNTFTISRNDGVDLSTSINIMTGLTVNGSISATTYFGDGSNLTGISTDDNYVTGGTYNSGTLTLDRQNGSVTVTGFTTDTNTFVTGFTYNDANTFTISNNDGSNYSASINTMTGLTINGESTGTTLTVNGQSVFSGSSTDVVQIYGSGSTSPLFRVEGSSGELFSISDSLIGDLFTVNNISGLPILVVNSDNTILWGDNTVPSLNTTVKKSINSGLSEIYSIPISAYTGGFFEYTVTGTGARAGSIMSIFSGTSVQFNETTTNDIGDTSGVTFDMNISGGTANLTVSATTNSWEIKTIVRSI